MDHNTSDMPIELSDAELANVQGGWNLFKALKRALVDPVVDYITGKADKEPQIDPFKDTSRYAPMTTVDGRPVEGIYRRL
jgi:bacteriocin-like protein